MISSIEDRGCTYTEKANPFAVSLIAIMIDNTLFWHLACFQDALKVHSVIDLLINQLAYKLGRTYHASVRIDKRVTCVPGGVQDMFILA